MNDNTSFDDVADGQNDGADAAPGTHGRRRGEKPKRSPLRAALPFLIVLVVIAGAAGGGIYGWSWITDNLSLSAEDEEFPGPGSGEVVVEIEPGDTGTDIANTLVEDGVIKTPGPFITRFANSGDADGIEPGLYRLKSEMTASDALELLLDPDSLAAHRVIIPEGWQASQIWEATSEATGIPVEDFEEAAADYTSFGIPENSADSLEGYLWPGRYDIAEDATAEDVIEMMWSRMESQLTDRGIPEDEWHETLTLASLAQGEVNQPDDYGMVVRVILNRLEGAGEADGDPMPLQFDSTVHYFTGKDGSVATTDEDRASDNPYNTYKHTGLPPGPIGSPGAETLDAVADPPEGDWLYFVTVNTETGETRFAETWDEHEENVEAWQDWEASRG